MINNIDRIQLKLQQNGYSITYSVVPAASSFANSPMIVCKKSMRPPLLSDTEAIRISLDKTSPLYDTNLSDYENCLLQLEEEITLQLADAEEFCGENHDEWF